MMERTYGRRNRALPAIYSSTLNEDVVDPFWDSLSSQETPPQDFYGFPFSSQESSAIWNSSIDPSSSQDNSLSLLPRKTRFEDNSCEDVGRRTKKQKKGKGNKGSSTFHSTEPLIPLTSTLMEAQEFGEMMEHVDEVNFALDGLKKGQQVRIRRASLLSLLSICDTVHQRRVLRAQGISKTITDAILGLSLDDKPSNLAAATIFLLLTSDGQDEHILESSDSIQFLVKLLRPVTSTAAEDKSQKIGSRLLALRKDYDVGRDTTKAPDSSSAAIVSKVQEILLNSKVIKSAHVVEERPELNPDWIALLTMEKACLSKVSFEDTSGTVRKTGGNFKEKLREHGGLGAVFEVAVNCHSIMEVSMKKHESPYSQDEKSDFDKQSLTLLLKCLKIMENSTFLSDGNQSHLLGIKRNVDIRGSRKSFTELMISVIKILSGLYLLGGSPAASSEVKSDATCHSSQLASVADCKVSNEVILISSTKDSSSQNSQSTSWLDCSQSGSATTSNTQNGPCLTRMRLSSSMSCNGASRSSDGETPANSTGSRRISFLSVRSASTKQEKFPIFEDNQDPFAFDEDDIEPSKWDLLSGKPNISVPQKRRINSRHIKDECHYQLPKSHQESDNAINSQPGSSNEENHPSSGTSNSNYIDEESTDLLADCLLAAVKVLMNLTNDNQFGCQQIAECGGLEIMSSLIARHFPSFSSPISSVNKIEENKLCKEYDPQNGRHLTDQELDFLVAILGLLVNLVEKDGRNRSRLAAASVPLPDLEGLKEENHHDVIPLLCSIFLANRGTGDTAEDEPGMPSDDEEAVLEGEKEAEKMIVEAYAALLLAFLSTESKSIRNAIADCLPNHNLAILVPVLERFVAFHLTLNMITPETHKAVNEVIESCRVH